MTKQKQETLESLMEKSREKSTILPKLPFGDKTDEGFHLVEFLASTPREFTFKDKFEGVDKEALSMPVRVLDSDFTGSMSDYSLIVPKDIEHSLGTAFFKLLDQCEGNLMGKRARIQAQNYQHKKYGVCRSYAISLVLVPEES